MRELRDRGIDPAAKAYGGADVYGSRIKTQARDIESTGNRQGACVFVRLHDPTSVNDAGLHSIQG